MSTVMHSFLIVWDQNGLEFVGDITQEEKNMAWAKLKDESFQPTIPSLSNLLLRARYNSHRHYEIYLVSAVDGITASDIIDMFNHAPQQAADTIRRLGKEIYSDRVIKKPVII